MPKRKEKSKRPLRFRKLTSPVDVRRAMLKVINALLAGELAHDVGGKVLFGLGMVQRAIEGEASENVERRLAALEEQAATREAGRPRLVHGA